MINFPLIIPQYNLNTDSWTEREFLTKRDFLFFVESQWKIPGKYELERTDLWRQPALHFQEHKTYTLLNENTEDYKEWWRTEKRKTKHGVIFNLGDKEFYVTGDYYWFLNFTPIPDKVKGKDEFAEPWDGHYHLSLYDIRAELMLFNDALVKARQKGMEQPNSELVLTESGWKQMGEIRKGDLVFTPKGTLTKVKEVFPQGLKDVYEVEFLDKRKVKCGLNHLWKLYSKQSQRWETLSLEYILKKGYTKPAFCKLKNGEKKEYLSYTYSISETESIKGGIFTKRDLKIHPYILGILIGDGEFKSTPRLSSSDEEIFNRVMELLGKDYEYGGIEKYSGHERRLIKYKKRFEEKESFTNGKFGVNPLVRYIKEYGLFNKTKNDKFIPFDYLHSDSTDRLELLQGLMDSDGYCSAKGADFHFTTTNINLANQVLYLCRSLGINGSLSTFEQESQNTYYRVRMKNKLPLFKLERKLKRQQLAQNRREKIPIIKITKLDYKEDSTCILVEDSEHCYLTTDFVPTHNSLYRASQLVKGLWFIKNFVGKMLGYEEDFVNDRGSWKFVVGYRNHLNEHTPWYRNFEPDESTNWEQKQTVMEGDVYSKKKFKGLRSKLMAATTKKNVAKSVGGALSMAWMEESGIAPNLDKVLEYAEAATKMGGLKTGMLYVGGAVGELKDCKPLEEIAFNPEANGFLGVEDIFSENPQGKICFFFPDYWNYITEEDGQIVRCYDKDGNSDVELAKKYLLQEDEVQKKKGEEKYRLWKSQHPFTLQDAFAVREENPFPVDLIKEHQTFLIQTYQPLTVELRKEGKKLKHHFIQGFPVKTLKIDPHKDNRGCIEIYELPIDNPPWGLYYAGVDPIAAKNTSTSKSLQAVTIYKAIHYVGEKLVMDYPVAQYTGRHPKWEDTYRTSLDLIHFYNTRTCVENNIKDFIEWMIKEGESKYLMRRKEVVMVNEFVPTSSIRDEIGVRMEGELKKKALAFIETYLDEIIGTVFDEQGNSSYIYGVTRIKDPMFLEELLKFAPRQNTDRLVSFTMALMAARSNTNRNIIVETKPYDYVPSKPRKLTIPSQFTNSPLLHGRTLPSTFKKR